MRKYFRRGIEYPNAFKPYHLQDLLTVYDLKKQNQSFKQISQILGRSVSSVLNMESILKNLQRFDNWEDATESLSLIHAGLSDQSQQALRQAWKTIKIKNGQIMPSIPSSNRNLSDVEIEKIFGETFTLEIAMSRLSKIYEDLKGAIADVVEKAVEQKVAEYKKDKEAEIASLKEVLDLAKTNNLETVLNQRLRGTV